jgi:spermidine synthase
MKIKLSLAAIIIAIIIASAVFFGQKNDLKILSHTENEFGPVWVFEQENMRCMSFLEPPSGILQSCMLLDNPKASVFHYAQIFLGSLFIQEQPRRILMVGLGGATVPKSLNILVPHAQIDIVEINPAIPEIVTKYFDFHESDRNHIIIEDGFEFAKNSPSNVYDIIFLDAFSPDYIPPSLLTDEFMQNIKRVLTKDGVIMMNTFATSEFKEQETKLFKKNFGEYYSLSTDQAEVIAAFKGPLPDLSEIAHKAALWRYRFVEVGVSQINVLSLFPKSN